ncbi:unnamed protein product [Pleuronectes platessa]|uniref:Uncharacterized protein n=1 Tax=Pleuronectes platessa TaxID=8262 RepID=A0A9N7V7X8_PLEPL|nr:unnamed protein product [Pleuronectes platessa]
MKKLEDKFSKLVSQLEEMARKPSDPGPSVLSAVGAVLHISHMTAPNLALPDRAGLTSYRTRVSLTRGVRRYEPCPLLIDVKNNKRPWRINDLQEIRTSLEARCLDMEEQIRVCELRVGGGLILPERGAQLVCGSTGRLVYVGKVCVYKCVHTSVLCELVPSGPGCLSGPLPCRWGGLRLHWAIWPPPRKMVHAEVEQRRERRMERRMEEG